VRRGTTIAITALLIVIVGAMAAQLYLAR